MQLGKLYICNEFKTGSSTGSEAAEEKTKLLQFASGNCHLVMQISLVKHSRHNFKTPSTFK